MSNNFNLIGKFTLFMLLSILLISFVSAGLEEKEIGLANQYNNFLTKNNVCVELINLLKDSTKDANFNGFVKDDASTEISELSDLEKFAKQQIKDIKKSPSKRCYISETGELISSTENVIYTEGRKFKALSSSAISLNLHSLSEEFIFANDEESSLGLNLKEDKNGLIKITNDGNLNDFSLNFDVNSIDTGDTPWIDSNLKPKVIGVKLSYESTNNENSFFNIMKRNLKGKPLIVQTKTITAGVRGSNLIISVDQNGDETMKVLHGEAVLINNDGDEVSVTDGEMVDLSNTDYNIEVAVFTSDEFEMAVKAENPNLKEEKIELLFNEYNEILSNDNKESPKAVESSSSESSFDIKGILEDFIDRLRNKDKVAIFIVLFVLILWLRR